MIRREFIQGIAGGLGAAAAATSAVKTKTVTYRIEGFTCVTCARGTRRAAERSEGHRAVQVQLSDRTAVIEYRPDLIDEQQIEAFIQELGFCAK
jgi:copper chaperone CopZ